MSGADGEAAVVTLGGAANHRRRLVRYQREQRQARRGAVVNHERGNILHGRQFLHLLPTLEEEEEALKLRHIVVNDERLDVGRTLMGWNRWGSGQS